MKNFKDIGKDFMNFDFDIDLIYNNYCKNSKNLHKSFTEGLLTHYRNHLIDSYPYIFGHLDIKNSQNINSYSFNSRPDGGLYATKTKGKFKKDIAEYDSLALLIKYNLPIIFESKITSINDLNGKNKGIFKFLNPKTLHRKSIPIKQLTKSTPLFFLVIEEELYNFLEYKNSSFSVDYNNFKEKNGIVVPFPLSKIKLEDFLENEI